MTEIEVPLEDGQSTTAFVYPAQSPSGPSATLILAHGAGAGQRHPFMVGFARALSGEAARGEGASAINVVTFNFLYMQQRRRVPDRMPQLVACYMAVIETAREHVASARDRLFIGGKSMGGRAATHVAVEYPALPIAGIVLLGYPLHPPGRPDQRRDAHLPQVGRPMLFMQGSRDTFGTPAELRPILEKISPPPTLHEVQGGDHSFKIAGKDPNKQAASYREIQDTIMKWITKVS